jgi:tRNA A37 threonylcarbamoyladenosine synthetase subunit TsaC/SUA5/YrdC
MRAALADGLVIAAAGDGGYLLVAHHDPRTALVGPVGPTTPPAPLSPPIMVVGHKNQAQALASDWSKEAGMLTDRMWPGPLIVMVPAQQRPGDGAVVHIAMPAPRPLRVLSRETGPLVTRPLRRPDGTAVVDPQEIGVWVTAGDVALIVDGGVCRGTGPTLVDCTVSPPVVRQVGALPESFVEGSLLMGVRRRRWFSGRSGS